MIRVYEKPRSKGDFADDIGESDCVLRTKIGSGPVIVGMVLNNRIVLDFPSNMIIIIRMQ